MRVVCWVGGGGEGGRGRVAQLNGTLASFVLETTLTEHGKRTDDGGGRSRSSS